jgi:hypothetical protein
MAVLLTGCGEDAAPPGPAAPASAAASAAAPSPSPSVALREPHSLVFSATGTAAISSVTYEFDGRKTTERSVSLPWRKVVDVPADGKRHSWNLTVKHRSGRVELVAFFDGAVTGETKGQTDGTGTASVGGDVIG